jgi:unspecific monooxygenase
VALLNGPDAIRHVLVENSGNYRRSRASIRILRPMVGNGLLLSEGEDWKHQRRTIGPALAPRVLPILCRHIERCAEEAITTLAASAGRPVDLLTEMQALALEIAGRSMFSLEMAQYRARLRGELMGYARLSQAHLLDMLLPPNIPSPRDFARARFHRRWMRLMDEIMQARLATPPAGEERDLFDLLRAARDPETDAGFSREQLRDQLATLMIAGHETTAVTLFWALYLLANVPVAQDRIAAEARSPELAFTRAVIPETLRLYPPAFTLARQALAPDRVEGLAIPKGMVLLIAPWVLHRHRKLWQDPDAFDPGRFMPGVPPPPRFAFLPFGAGPRVCVGAQFATAEATIVLARLAATFRIELLDPAPVIPTAIITTQPNRRPMFRLTRR